MRLAKLSGEELLGFIKVGVKLVDLAIPKPKKQHNDNPLIKWNSDLHPATLS